MIVDHVLGHHIVQFLAEFCPPGTRALRCKEHHPRGVGHLALGQDDVGIAVYQGQVATGLGEGKDAVFQEEGVPGLDLDRHRPFRRDDQIGEVVLRQGILQIDFHPPLSLSSGFNRIEFGFIDAGLYRHRDDLDGLPLGSILDQNIGLYRGLVRGGQSEVEGQTIGLCCKRLDVTGHQAHIVLPRAHLEQLDASRNGFPQARPVTDENDAIPVRATLFQRQRGQGPFLQRTGRRFDAIQGLHERTWIGGEVTVELDIPGHGGNRRLLIGAETPHDLGGHSFGQGQSCLPLIPRIHGRAVVHQQQEIFAFVPREFRGAEGEDDGEKGQQHEQETEQVPQFLEETAAPFLVEQGLPQEIGRGGLASRTQLQEIDRDQGHQPQQGPEENRKEECHATSPPRRRMPCITSSKGTSVVVETRPMPCLAQNCCRPAFQSATAFS